MELDSQILEFSKALSYLEKNLVGANTLSDFAFRKIKDSQGTLSTFLPRSTLQEDIHNFQRGGGESPPVSTIVSFVFEKLKENTSLSCIFDDVVMDYKPDSSEKTFVSNGLHCESEQYYCINHLDSIDTVQECFSISAESFWHSLCVMTSYALPKREDKSITREEIEEACSRAEMILILAYDAEGYILWERT